MLMAFEDPLVEDLQVYNPELIQVRVISGNGSSAVNYLSQDQDNTSSNPSCRCTFSLSMLFKCSAFKQVAYGGPIVRIQAAC